MALAGYGIAEAYVMKKLHKEKMKGEEKEEKTKMDMAGSEAKRSSGGCFFWCSKNEHRTSTARINDYNHKEDDGINGDPK